MDLGCCCGKRPASVVGEMAEKRQRSLPELQTNQAASPLASGDKYQAQLQPPPPQELQSASEEPHSSPTVLMSFSQASSNLDQPIMTGNGFFVPVSPNDSPGNGLIKSKSGSLPDRYAVRGPFREAFVSNMTPPGSVHSSPHHSAAANRNEVSSSPLLAKDKENSSSKKWSFGGLFRRKSKTGGSQSPAGGNCSSTALSKSAISMPMSSPQLLRAAEGSPSLQARPQRLEPANRVHIGGTSAPAPAQRNSNKYVSTPTQTRYKAKLSESDITSEDSELEAETWNEPTKSQPEQQPAANFKQSFLARRLSRRKEKAARKRAAAAAAAANASSPPQQQHNGGGFLKLPAGASAKLSHGKRVGSSPDSLNNGTTTTTGLASNGGPSWPSWEITKKVPQLQQPLNNYSSSGSLSLSQEGSSTKGSRAAAKEAVKARAVARRESFIQDSSSEEDEDRSRSSIVGSHSSLTARQRKARPLFVLNNNNNNSNNNNNVNNVPTTIPQQHFRPVVVDHVRNSPSHLKSDRQNNNNNNNNNSPTRKQLLVNGGSSSPKWEARVVYTQESQELESPFVVKLPPNRNLDTNKRMSTGSASEDQVITAGLRVPISANNGQVIMQQVHYANLPNPLQHNNAGRKQQHHRSVTPQLNNYYNVSVSPPPPPPRKELPRHVLNQNFYRPVSCSYLDSFQSYYNPHHHQQQQQPNPVRPASPNVTSYSPEEHHHLYYNHDNSHEVLPHHLHHHHQQQQQQQYYVSDNGNYYDYYYDNSDLHQQQQQQFADNLRGGNFTAAHNKQIALMRSPSEPPEIKVHFSARESPVKRKAATPSPAPNYPHSSSPHQPSSVVTSKLGFPVRKFQEANKIHSPVHMRASEFWRKKELELTGNAAAAAAANPAPSSKKYMSRIRSADSSPLPLHRMMRRSPAVLNNSNESISSLSSFSAEAASPQLTKSNHCQALSKRAADSHLNRNNSPRQSLEREKSGGGSASERPSNKLRSLVQLNNGKSPGRNLEDALNELEDMYKSLRLSDEDLLDRAERRDLPTPHQQLRNAPLAPLPLKFEAQALGSVESLATGTSSGSGTNYSSSDNPNRVRAPPLRRSCRPDRISDDMARRKCDHQESKPHDPRAVVSQSGSYMVLSPAFSPPVSPCPPSDPPLSLAYSPYPEEPDLMLDDVSFRQYRRANSIRIIDPQPPFGIPLGPISAAPETDYLHSKRSDRIRPLFKPTKNPDLINDDIAFRNLRKDLSQEQNLSKDWTPRLFSPSRDKVFPLGAAAEDERGRKLRAIRSLSANMTNYAPLGDNPFRSGSADRMGKWNSFTDLLRPSSNSPSRRRTYLQPSWVEQIEKAQTSTETLSESRISNNKASLEEPQVWERKLPSKTVQLTPDLYDPSSKCPRPWTDMIFQDFQQQEEQEKLEKVAQETAGTNADVNSNGINESTKTTELSNNQTSSNDVRESSAQSMPQQLQQGNSQSARSDDEESKQCKANNGAAAAADSSTAALLLARHRRGSWVEPSRVANNLSTALHPDDDKRRKSWSDVPSLTSAAESPKRLFNPLPVTRKIKQINLETFNNHNNNQKSTLVERKLGESSGSGEMELDVLMDMLLGQADTCDSLVKSTSERDNQLSLPQTDGNSNQSGLPRIPPRECEPASSSAVQIVAVTMKAAAPALNPCPNPPAQNQARASSKKSPLEASPEGGNREKPSSIDELINSINDSLPELETSCCTSSTKSNDSSLSSISSGADSVTQSGGGGGQQQAPSPGVPNSPLPTTVLLAQQQARQTEPKSAAEQLRTPTSNSSCDTLLERVEQRRASVFSSGSEKEGGGPDGGQVLGQKAPEDTKDRTTTSERNLDNKNLSFFSKKEESPLRGLRTHLPFLRNSTSRSRSQSYIGSVSSSPSTTYSDESRREKDKSHKRKSYLNRAFTDEPVPDKEHYLTPRESVGKRVDNEAEVSAGNSACGRRKSSSSICKVPSIPAVLTTRTTRADGVDQGNGMDANGQSSKKTEQNSISSPVSNSTGQQSSSWCKFDSAQNSKVHSLQPATVVVKRDSFSDAEGVSFIKKLLQKESMAEKAAAAAAGVGPAKQSGSQSGSSSRDSAAFMLKKSSSAGSNSYWSRLSSSQPAFLKKIFDRAPKPEQVSKCAGGKGKEAVSVDVVERSTEGGGCDDVPMEPEVEPIIGCTVAQKASYFMKLEHEQRFSKWRKNSLDSSGSSPLTMLPLQAANKHYSSSELPSLKTCSHPTGGLSESGQSKISNEEDGHPGKNPFETGLRAAPDSEPNLAQGHSFNFDYGERLPKTYIAPHQSNGRLKERVNMFDQLISTRGSGKSGSGQGPGLPKGPKSGYPMLHSSSAVMTNSEAHKFSSAAKFEGATWTVPAPTVPPPTNLQRRGSTSDIELSSSTPKYSPAASRKRGSWKSRSWFVSDDASEDGEVSSGGLEVAEIISRSYENSPVARKKCWKAQQKQNQASFTKEIWRRCKINDNWHNPFASATANERTGNGNAQAYTVTTNVTHKVVSDPTLPSGPKGAPSSSSESLQVHPALRQSSPPSTSNLLQILTVLSSSNDELSDSHRPCNKTSEQESAAADECPQGRRRKDKGHCDRSQGSSSSSPSMVVDDGGSLQSNDMSSQQVDSSFQSLLQFGKEQTQLISEGLATTTTRMPEPVQSVENLATTTTTAGQSVDAHATPLDNQESDMNSVRRETELLVMKKNVSVLRRKGSGSKCRNPLRALAARIDFRNQWHSDVSSEVRFEG